jgi:hypothetical protein
MVQLDSRGQVVYGMLAGRRMCMDYGVKYNVQIGLSMQALAMLLSAGAHLSPGNPGRTPGLVGSENL